jgi:hypothetical protein
MGETTHLKVLELLARYAHGLDDGDVSAVLACFALDARADYNGGAISLNGHAELEPFFKEALGKPSTHLFSNTIVEVDGETATTRSSAVAFVTRTEGQVTVRGLVYETRCGRDGDEWKFRQLTHRLTWQCALPIDGIPAAIIRNS